MHGAPRRDETSRDTRLRSVGQRREVAPEGERIAPAERHLGIVVQRGFVDAAVKPRDAERRRSVGVPEVAQGHRTAERLADARIRGNGPRVAVRGEAELGQLAGDDERIARRNLVLVAEAQTVVEETETHREAHLAAAVQRDGHLVVAAAVALVLAPRLGPLLIDRGVFGPVHPEIVREVRLRGLQTEQRRSEKRTVADRDRIAHFAALPVRGELQTDRTVGRGDLGFRRAGRSERRRDLAADEARFAHARNDAFAAAGENQLHGFGEGVAEGLFEVSERQHLGMHGPAGHRENLRLGGIGHCMSFLMRFSRSSSRSMFGPSLRARSGSGCTSKK